MKKLGIVVLISLALAGCGHRLPTTESRLANTAIGAGAGCLIGAGAGALFVAPHAVALGTGIGCASGAVVGATLPARGL